MQNDGLGWEAERRWRNVKLDLSHQRNGVTDLDVQIAEFECEADQGTLS